MRVKLPAALVTISMLDENKGKCRYRRGSKLTCWRRVETDMMDLKIFTAEHYLPITAALNHRPGVPSPPATPEIKPADKPDVPRSASLSSAMPEDRIRVLSLNCWSVPPSSAACCKLNSSKVETIKSGALPASEYPALDDDFGNPMAHAEVEEELASKSEKRNRRSLLVKRSGHLSPVKIMKAFDGSLNWAALAGTSLAKERRELRQQDASELADSEARDFSQPWLDPMSKETDKMFAQDMRGSLKSQRAGEVPKWKEQTFNKATTYGEITTLSIQRKALPIYKLRNPLLQAIGDVRYTTFLSAHLLTNNYSIKF